jgi:acetyl-CoA carboxylase biotin carboxylase subunit
VTPFYDPMISKLVAWAETRDLAIERLKRALGDYALTGITTNIPYLMAAVDHPAFRAGDYDTGFCVKYEKELVRPADHSLEEVALIAAAVVAHQRGQAEAEAATAQGAAPGPTDWSRLEPVNAQRGGGQR